MMIMMILFWFITDKRVSYLTDISDALNDEEAMEVYMDSKEIGLL